MSLALVQTLTVARLRFTAGAAFLRGEAYWREGRVVSFAQVGDAIDGVVDGGSRYRVRLSADAAGLSSSCTCLGGGPICKHAVAVGLAFLDQLTTGKGLGRRRPTPALGSPQPPARPAVPLEDAGFADRAALEAWAAQHDVAFALAYTAERLCPRLPPELAQRHGLLPLLGGLALGDVGSREGVRARIGVQALEQPIAQAAHRELLQIAASVRAGCEEERARPPAPDPGDRPDDTAPDDAILASLWSRLIDARRELRARAVPRSRVARARGKWRFDAPACAVVWTEPVRVFRRTSDGSGSGPAARSGGRTPVGVEARLTLPSSGAAPIDIECTCALPAAPCTHGLALIDATLDMLADPARTAEARAVAGELLRPGWDRLLGELEALGARAAPPRPAIEVGWRLETALGRLTLSPLVKEQPDAGSITAATRPTVRRLLEDHRDRLAEVDLRIAEHVAAWLPPPRGLPAPAGRSTTYPVAALLAAVGHPRVTAEWSDAPIAIQRAALGFAARLDGDHICLEPTIDGRPCAPGELTRLLASFPAGEPLAIQQPERGRCLLVDVAGEARRLWALLVRHGDRFPPESHARLRAQLSRLEDRLPLVLPEALAASGEPPSSREPP